MKKSYKNFTLFGLLVAAQIFAGQKALSNPADLLIQLNEPQPQEEEPLPLEENLTVSANKQAIANLLTYFTLGNDPFYNRVLSPAKSLNQQRSDSDRTAEANEKIQSNLAAIMDAFDKAPEEQKAAQVEATLKKLDPNFEKGQSGRIEFTDGDISAAFSRIGFVIEKGNATAEMVLNAFTSYKRAAKPSDHVFEYEDYQDITRGGVTTRQGSDTAWFPPQAPAAMPLGGSVVVKKCRQILGWKCGTTLYHADQKENFKYVFMGNYDLSKNPDNPHFKGDGRTKNQVAGSTALFIMKESEKHILFAAADSTWNRKGLSFTSIIQSEYQKDLNKFKQRLMFDLGRTKK
jgi:hypothetical protein